MALLPVIVSEHGATPTLLILLYVIATGFTIAVNIAYYRKQEDRYGEKLIRAHLAFTIVGTVTFALFSAVMWLWAAKYSETTSDRSRRLTLGLVVIFLLRDLPLFCIEYHAILTEGWPDPYQGFAFIVTLLLFLFSGIFSWANYAWIMARYMNSVFGHGDSNGGLKTGAEQVYVLRPASPTEAMAWDQRMLPPPPGNTGLRSGSRYSTYHNTSGDIVNDDPQLFGRSPLEMFAPSHASPLAHQPPALMAQSQSPNRVKQPQQQYHMSQSQSGGVMMDDEELKPFGNTPARSVQSGYGGGYHIGGGGSDTQTSYAPQQTVIQQQLAALQAKQQRGRRNSLSQQQHNASVGGYSQHSERGPSNAPQQGYNSQYEEARASPSTNRRAMASIPMHSPLGSPRSPASPTTSAGGYSNFGNAANERSINRGSNYNYTNSQQYPSNDEEGSDRYIRSPRSQPPSHQWARNASPQDNRQQRVASPASTYHHSTTGQSPYRQGQPSPSSPFTVEQYVVR